jgi:hypothetical protein
MGTTSFRTREFNLKIEQQLNLLSAFWQEHKNENWGSNSKLQAEYYDYMKRHNFVMEEANNKPKDAREKTSGLVDIGLITAGRQLTKAGETLLEISKKPYSQTDNLLQIPADSCIYLKQLIKTHNKVDKNNIRPFVILILALQKLDYLTYDEFTFLLPLIISESKFDFILKKIAEIRASKTTKEDVIVQTLMQMDNYKRALDLFLSNKVTEDLICEIGLNRKSRTFDKPYFELYKELKLYALDKQSNALGIFNACKKIKTGKHWRQYLFNTISEAKIKKDGVKTLNRHSIFNAKNENKFKKEFFQLMHLFKAKATLSDYFDLNKRYFGTADILLFKDNKVELDTIPKCFFELCPGLSEIAFEASADLFENIEIDKIIPKYNLTEDKLFAKLETGYGEKITSLSAVKQFVDNERHKRMNELIDNKFTDEKLLLLLDDFETRNDDNIHSAVTNNATIPTIFEYIIAIIWYKISNRQGRILDYMNLSLDADLLPKTHAAGGEDIAYQYDATETYPKHTLLIELTLADNTNQRRMEMEPVSRHLGEYLLKNETQTAYAVFVTTFLHINVISDFRGRKQMPYYNSDGSKEINGMKIIPLQTSELKTIITNGIHYEQLYLLFDRAFNADTPPNRWYDSEIATKIPS